MAATVNSSNSVSNDDLYLLAEKIADEIGADFNKLSYFDRYGFRLDDETTAELYEDSGEYIFTSPDLSIIEHSSDYGNGLYEFFDAISYYFQ